MITVQLNIFSPIQKNLRQSNIPSLQLSTLASSNMGHAWGKNVRSSNFAVLLLVSIAAGATSLIHECNSFRSVSKSAKRSLYLNTALNNFEGSSGQIVPVSIGASSRKESGHTLSAVLMAIALAVPQATRASAPPALGVDKDGFFERELF